jgi:hypothetical protein
MSTVHWPFPGTDGRTGMNGAPLVRALLPPARFVDGDWVSTRWGTALVLKVCDWAAIGGRAYHVRHTWCDSPPGFGHFFGEDECEPAAKPEPQPLEGPKGPPSATHTPQLDLFA